MSLFADEEFQLLSGKDLAEVVYKEFPLMRFSAIMNLFEQYYNIYEYNTFIWSFW